MFAFITGYDWWEGRNGTNIVFHSATSELRPEIGNNNPTSLKLEKRFRPKHSQSFNLKILFRWAESSQAAWVFFNKNPEQ